MAALPNLEEWITSSNDALNISIVAPTKNGLQSISSFHPRFTYPIFGEEEKIFGYKGLKINLRYRANDMRPHLKVSHSKKLTPQGDAEPDDIIGILKEGNHLPSVAFTKESDFENSSKQLSADWTPPGTLHDAFEGPDGQYEIWKGSLEDPAVRQLNSRVQFLVPLFIEGGSYIGQKPDSDSTELDLSDADRWTLFFLYKKDKAPADPEKSPYVFVGYSTIYRFYWFQPTPPASPSDSWELPAGDLELSQLPCRTRLSQFIILPPFQGKGCGARLYKSIFQYYQKHAQTQEFTVEDPNEAFDDLRDVCDLEYLRTLPEFNELRVDPNVSIPKSGTIPQLIVGGDKAEEIQRKAKIAPRQFNRVLEMHLMSQLPESVRPSMDLDKDVPAPTAKDLKQQRVWQLIAKQRLYRHNRDALSQLEPEERIEKLDEVLGGVELANSRILALYERASQRSSAAKRKPDTDANDAPSKKAKTD